MTPARIFHVALRSDWEAALASGSYTTSTRGRTLAEEGFVHASRGDQWQGVRDRFYADATEPLVLLVIDTAALSSPVVEEVPAGAAESFPHVYGPIDLTAVVQAVPLDTAGNPPGDSFSTLFLREVFRNALVGTLVLALVVAGALIGRELDPEWGALTGTLVAVATGLLILVVLRHRRSGVRGGLR